MGGDGRGTHRRPAQLRGARRAARRPARDPGGLPAARHPRPAALPHLVRLLPPGRSRPPGTRSPYRAPRAEGRRGRLADRRTMALRLPAPLLLILADRPDSLTQKIRGLQWWAPYCTDAAAEEHERARRAQQE